MPAADARQIPGLINPAEVVVHVLAVVFIAGAVREDDLRIRFSHLLHHVHIVEAGAENHLAAFLDQLFDGVLRFRGVGLGNVVLADDLAVLQAQTFCMATMP